MKQRWDIERTQKRKEELILSKMGDDSQERKDNEKIALKERVSLWRKTPIEFNYDIDDELNNTLKRSLKTHGYSIRPVADIKWKGQL